MDIKYEKWNFDLNNNQKVIEVRKKGTYEGKVFKEDFEVFRQLKRNWCDTRSCGLYWR